MLEMQSVPMLLELLDEVDGITAGSRVAFQAQAALQRRLCAKPYTGPSQGCVG